MLDIKFIRSNSHLVEDNLRRREDPEKIRMLHQLMKNDDDRREIITRLDALRQVRNDASVEISNLKKSRQDISKKLGEMSKISDDISKFETKLDEVETRCRFDLMRIPNMLHASVPIGKDDNENVEIRRWGKQNFGFEPKDHMTILEKMNLIDSKSAAGVVGHGFFYLKGKLAKLDYALQMFAVDVLIDRGFTLIEPPFMLQRKPYEGVTDLSDFESVMYKIENEDLYLIATSEHPVAAMMMDKVVLSDDLPLKFAGISPCFRREVGAHGKYTRGLFRMHQFNKIEQFIFCLPDQSWELHEELQRNSEEMMELLEIPYRVVNICTGDIGSIAAKKYDIEILMADGKYREVGSNSNCTDYQARRLNVKYRGKEGQAPAGFVHTLNNTGIATSRVMIAVLENHQQKDGSVKIPKALQKYTGFSEISAK
ncbi:MAG: serine--tRNA ligase [Candidatus Aenigmatarchaeota archaeon]